MAKVMLVEDDNNLREIYEARLAAEGYEIVAAQDGEEALALAVKERPDLIIADIMMPKVSGFDMLDILRSTPETKHTKIIMMTALSQAEDKTRAEKLGADRYLVKSQVTLEDVVKVASEMLNQADAAPKSADTPNVSLTEASAATSPVTPTMAATPVVEEPAATDDASNDDTAQSDGDDTKAAPEPPKPDPTPAPSDASGPTIVAPTNDASNLSNTTAEEEATVTKQIDDFITQNPTLTTSAEPEKEKQEETKPVDEPAANVPSAPEAPKPAEPTETPKTTSIPVKVTDDAITEESIPATAPTTDADQTLAKAVDSLVTNKPDTETEAKTPAPSEEAPAPESNEPQLAKKRGGERVITPLSDPKDNVPDLQALLAKEEQNDGISTPSANTVIAPGGTVQTLTPTSEETPTVPDNGMQPGGTVVPAPPDTSETPKTDNPSNIAL